MWISPVGKGESMKRKRTSQDTAKTTAAVPGLPADLSPEDQEHLQNFEARLQLVRDRTRGVAEGWATGLYLWGGGGTSKSFTVQEELDRLKVGYKVTNSRLTGRGLFDLLEEFPDMVHVLEDMERMCLDPNAAGVLRSACWAQRSQKGKQHPERIITWRAFKTKLEITFTGGIILIQNCPLHELPELRALKTRISHQHLQPKHEEIIAKMRAIALQGYEHGDHSLTKTECGTVCQYVIDKCKEHERNPDLRMLLHGFHDFLQNKAGHAETDWKDLIDSRLKEQVIRPEHVGGRAAQTAREQAIAVEIAGMNISGKEKVKLWTERTGKSGRAYHRRLKEPQVC